MPIIFHFLRFVAQLWLALHGANKNFNWWKWRYTEKLDYSSAGKVRIISARFSQSSATASAASWLSRDSGVKLVPVANSKSFRRFSVRAQWKRRWWLVIRSPHSGQSSGKDSPFSILHLQQDKTKSSGNLARWDGSWAKNGSTPKGLSTRNRSADEPFEKVRWEWWQYCEKTSYNCPSSSQPFSPMRICFWKVLWAGPKIRQYMSKLRRLWGSVSQGLDEFEPLSGIFWIDWDCRTEIMKSFRSV